MSLLDPLKRLVRVATRRVESSPGLVVQPYRGYGSRKEIFLRGGVFEQPAGSRRLGESFRLLSRIMQRLLRTGASGIDVDVHFYGQSARVTTDEDGYFQAHLLLDEEPPSDRIWHAIEVELADPPSDKTIARRSSTSEIFIPGERSRFVVVSDIDDTIMYTGVANKLKMFWRLFAQDAESRIAFPGVASLYHAFHIGKGGDEDNPILYVSRGHWGLYEMLVEFFHVHDIPPGPILFLREWGVSLTSPIPRRAVDHKAELLRTMLAIYDTSPFVLVGDSGQHDPEIYAEVVRAYPDRIAAVYIRDVSGSTTRAGEIETLASEIEEAGSSLVLAADSYAMARHAREHGLISASAMEHVLNERVREGEPMPERRSGPVVVDS